MAKSEVVSPAPTPSTNVSAPKGSTTNGVPGYQKRTSSPRQKEEVTFSKNPPGFKK